MGGLPRIRVDFNQTFENGSVDLRPAKEELARLPKLKERMRVVLWDEGIPDVTAELHFDKARKEWVAIPDNHSCAVCGEDIGCGATFREACSDCGRAYCANCHVGFCFDHGTPSQPCPRCKQTLL
jgi:hypothetical protein